MNINWEKAGYQAILITNPKNIRHLTNLNASFGFVVITKEKTVLFADSRYILEAKRVYKNGEVILFKGMKQIEEYLQPFETVAIEYDFVPVAQKKAYRKIIKNITGINGQELRIIKSESDIASMKKAVNITKEVMQWASEQLKEGITEREISRMVVFKLNELGSEDLDYQPIVAFGENSAKPHAKPSMKKLEKGQTIMFDFAAVIDGFTADLTRNYSFGEVDEEIKKIDALVRKAQLAGIAAVKPGVTGADIDKICRDIIKEAGYGENFGHGTGHGLGRDVHELPNVGPASDIVFEPGHILTVEPGIYIEGKGGIRWEDDILVTKDGHEVL
ncbi:MAG: aminopeptidase P family protein [Mycoplasmataceae bacterium]|nr:aminopeptidase P family protein [Mycoplasmataceae bacterium]